MSNTAHINAISMATGYDGDSVSWRTDNGVKIALEGSPLEFLNTLKNNYPEVNTIRLDFNACTLKNSARLEDWRTFAQSAAEYGYKLIIQNSDGAMANNEGHVKVGGIQPAEPGQIDALTNSTAADGYIEKVADDWGAILDWFHAEAQEEILQAVYGWELLNEPAVYGTNTESAGVYA